MDIQLVVTNALNSIAKELVPLPAEFGSWTKKLIAHLSETGRQNGFESCAHSCKRGEFLYDLVWLKTDSEGFVLDVALVAECEWGKNHHVLDDFRKLLMARAECRLIIFDGENVKNADDLIQDLKENITRFAKTKTGDRYLFAFWQDNAFQVKPHNV